MKRSLGLSGVIHRVVATALFTISLSVAAQTTSTKVVTVKSATTSAAGKPASTTSTVAGNSQYHTAPASTASSSSHVTQTRVNVETAAAPTSSATLSTSSVSTRARVSGVHPHFGGPSGPVINSVQFAAAEVNGAAVTMTLTYPGIAGTATAAVSAGLDFAVQSTTCATSACSVVVTFSAKFPGTRYDAVTVTNSDGVALYRTFVYGLGKGPQFRIDLGGYSGYYGFTSTPPNTVAFGPDRTLYVTSMSGSSVLLRSADGTISSITVTGLNTPSGIAVNGARYVYVADKTSNTVIIYNPTDSTTSTLATTPLSNPGQIAIDGTGAVYIADTGNGRIIKIDNQNVETTLASGLTMPTAVAVDSNGKVYYADQAASDEIFTIAPGSTTPVLYQDHINQVPHSLAVDAAGTIYLTTDMGLNRFYSGSQQQSYDNGLDQPFGFAIDVNGGIAYTTPGRNSFTSVDPNSANFILSAPPGTQVTGTFTVSNTGNEPLTLSSLTIDQPQWTFDPNSICQNGTVLATQARCDVTVDFTPPTAAEYDAHVHISSDSLHTPGTMGTFYLYGSGTGDASHTDLTAAPSAVMVGNPVRLLATVVNDGGTNTPTGSVTFYDADQAIGTVTLPAPNEHVEFDTSSLAEGTHTITAKYSGDVHVDSNTSNAVTVVVSTGAPDPNNGVSVAVHDFGTANVGANGNTFNFSYIQNGQTLTVSGSDFILGQPSCDNTCTVTVTFTPQYPGLRQGVVSISSFSGPVVSKTLVYGVGTAPQLGFNSGTDSVYSNLTAPSIIGISPSGHRYISDSSTNQVYDITDDGPSPLPILNLATPAGIAVGPDGKVYVSDSTNNLIFTFDPSTQVEGVLATSQLSGPTGLTVDRAGNLAILDAGNNRIIRLTPQGVETTLASNIMHLASITSDSAGNIYYGTVTGDSQQGVYEIPADGSQTSQTFNGEGPIHALAVDASGAFYFQNDNFTNIFPPPPQNQLLLPYEFAGNLGNRQTGLALGANGDVFATDSDSGQYFQSNRSTGNTYSFVTVGTSGNVAVTVFNDGNAPLTLSALAVSGSTFTVLSTSTCTAGTQLPPGGNCTVALKYTPTQAGENHESLTITSNSLNNLGFQNSYDLYGEASNPLQATTNALTFSPSSPTLGQTVTLTATVSAPPAANIPPGGQVTFMDGSNVLGVAYLGYQTSGNTASANFQVSNLSQGSHSITAVYAGDSNYITSTSSAVNVVVGAAPPAATSSQDFGSVAVGQSVTQSITFNLTGITDIRLATGSEYTFTQYTCTTSSCTVPVRFAPQVPGLRPDALLVRDTNGALLAKAFLYGVGTSGQFGFLPGTSSIDSTIQAPVGITFTPDGVGYVTDAATNQVHELITGDPALPITGLSSPAGIAVDGARTLYIADRTANRIVTFDFERNTQGVLATSGLSNPGGVATDGQGNLFISDNGNNRIVKISNMGVQTTFASGLNSPQGVATDAAGNVYFADNGSFGEIGKIPAAGGTPTVLANTLGTPMGIAVDASGSIYYTGGFAGIHDLIPGVGTVAFSGSTTGSLTGIGINFNGDVWTTQPTSASLEQLHRASTNFFTSTAVGTPSSHTVQVVNTGNTSLTLSNVAFASGTVFSIGSGNTCTNGGVLMPGSVCQTPVQFAPVAAQNYSDTLTYTSNTLNNIGSGNQDSESGTGTAPPQAPSTTTLAANPATAMLGSPVVLTATVADTSAVTPTGTVTFVDGTTQLGTATLGSATGSGMATASLTISTLSLGSHSIRALYSGSTAVGSSNSALQTVIISQITTATALRLSAASITTAQTETLTATITGAASPALTGTVVFYDGTSQVGSVAVTATSTGGVATLALSGLTAGTHQLSATYSGDTNYTQSNDGPATVTVTQAATTINSQSFGSVPVAGQTVSMTLSYSTVAGGVTLALTNALDFTMTPQSCTQTTCSTVVTFAPKFPGSRTDALTVKDVNNTLIAKTFLYGSGTAPQFAFEPGVASLAFVGQATNPTGVAVGPNGSLYVSDSANNRVSVQFTNGSVGTIPFTGLGKPGGLAVDGSNTVYVADQTHNVILASDAAGVTITVTTSALSGPNFLAVDGTGALYIADTGNNRILKIDNQGVETTARTLTVAPLGLAVDAAMNIYYADASRGGEITKVNAGGFGSTTISGVGATINALAVDAGGRLYWTALNGTQSSIYTSLLGSGTTTNYILSSATQAGTGIALDGAGRIVATEPTVGRVDVYDRSVNNASLTTQVGVQAQASFNIENTGNATLTLSGLSAGGTGYSIDAASTCSASTALILSQKCAVTVDFTPAATGSSQGTVTFTSNSLNASGTQNVFTLSGSGSAVPLSMTMLAVSSSTVAIGQPVTLTATVNAGSVQPTGMVNFFDGSTMIGSATLGAGSGGTAMAQFATSSLGLGTHSLTAMYVGNGTAPASVSAAQSVSVTQASTTTAVAVSTPTVAVGRPVTLTATIAGSASPVMSGMVTFFDGTNSLGSSMVTATSTGGTSQITVTTLSVGAHSITARYTGDTNYTASTSTAQAVTVTQVTTTTALTAAPASVTLGQTETLTATIGGGIGSPAATGTVTYFDGTTLLGTANVTATSTGGTATLTLLTLTAGTHSITARYTGDTNYTASTSAAQTVTVTQATTTATLGVSAASINVGQSETLTATIQGLSSTLPTGNVTFFDGTTSLGTGTIGSTTQGTSSTATLTVSTLTVGTHTITARYNGDTSYTASTSAAQTVTVAQLATSTAVGLSAAVINAGQPETLTATIAGAASPSLTGSVTFFDGATSLGTGTVTSTPTGGTASLTVTTLAGGTRSIAARYGGDTNYGGSVSAAQTVTVNANTQTIAFPAIPTHTLGDAPFTLSATASSGLAVSYAVVSGPATVSGSTVTLTGTGTVVIQATQVGNASYNAATPVSQTFTVVPPTPTLTSLSPAGAVIGASATTVTLTGTNFSTADTVQINGSSIATNFVNATTLTAIVPATLQGAAATLQITVFDPVLQKSTAALPFTISATPSVVFTGPTTTQPAQQPTVTLTLTNPYPVALTTTLTLAFTPASTSLTDDPNVQFSTGGRTETFVIPANSTITPAILLQSGTVAGKITVTLVLTNASGVNVTPANVTPVVITIAAAIPAISTTGVARSGNRLTVSVHAFSNTREVTRAIFHFTPAAGYTVDTPDITADVSAAFAAWFSSTASQQYGSSFTYAQDFDLTNNATTVGTVTVTLVNSVGTSTVGTAQ